MIIEKNTVQSNRIQAILLTVLLFSTSLGFFLLSAISDGRLSLFFRLSAPVFIIAGILVSTRFLLYSYTYILSDFEFVIEKHNKYSRQFECRIYLHSVSGVYSRKDKKKLPKDMPRHNYCASVFPKNAYVIIFESGDITEAIIFEPTPSFVCQLKKFTENTFTLP